MINYYIIDNLMNFNKLFDYRKDLENVDVPVLHLKIDVQSLFDFDNT